MSRRKSETFPTEVRAASETPRAVPRQSIYLYTAAALLSLIGLADSIYLTIEHLAGRAVQCTVTSGCEEVLTSAYASIGGVPLAGVGAVAYFVVFSTAILAAFGNRPAGNLLFYVVALMLVVSVYLFALQAFVLHAFCQFCLLSGAVTLLLALIVAAEQFYVRRKR
jgi:uncharacterized membrane protein